MNSLICPVLILINLTTTWTKKDEKILTRAKYVCHNDERYSSDTPCLVKFVKKPDQVYNAICGAKR